MWVEGVRLTWFCLRSVGWGVATRDSGCRVSGFQGVKAFRVSSFRVEDLGDGSLVSDFRV